MKRIIILLLAISFLASGYKTKPDKAEFVDSIANETVPKLVKEFDYFQPEEFIKDCLDGSIVIKSFGIFDVAKLPNGEGLGSIAIGAFGKIWTYGQKINEQVIPMLADAITDVINQGGK